MITITPVTTIPLTYNDFAHHMTYASSLLDHDAKLNALFVNDPTYLGQLSIDVTEAISHTTQLLAALFHLPSAIPNTNLSILDLWLYDYNCGFNFLPGTYIDHLAPQDDTDHRAPDLSTLPLLYDYVTYVYFREQKGLYNENADPETPDNRSSAESNVQLVLSAES